MTLDGATYPVGTVWSADGSARQIDAADLRIDECPPRAAVDAPASATTIAGSIARCEGAGLVVQRYADGRGACPICGAAVRLLWSTTGNQDRGRLRPHPRKP